MLERRKVYIEFTGKSSVLLVTPYVSKEYQLKPEDDCDTIDLVSLKRRDSSEDLHFYASIDVDTTDDEGRLLSTPDYKLKVYVREDEHNFDCIEEVSVTPAENKKKIEVSFPVRD